MQYRIALHMAAVAISFASLSTARATGSKIDANHLCADGAAIVSKAQEAIGKANAWNNGLWEAVQFDWLSGTINKKIDDISNDCQKIPVMSEEDSSKVLNTAGVPLTEHFEQFMGIVKDNVPMHAGSYKGEIEKSMPTLHKKINKYCSNLEPKISGDDSKAQLDEQCGRMYSAINDAYVSYGNGNQAPVDKY